MPKNQKMLLRIIFVFNKCNQVKRPKYDILKKFTPSVMYVRNIFVKRVLILEPKQDEDQIQFVP